MPCSEAVELYSVVHPIFSNIVTVKSEIGKPANRLHENSLMCTSHVYSLLNEVRIVNAGFPASHQQGVSCPSQVVPSSYSALYLLILSCISHKVRLDNYIQPFIYFYVTKQIVIKSQMEMIKPKNSFFS